MRSFLLTLVLAVLLAPAALATPTFGAPSETDPYCELARNGAPRDYPGIGWYPEIVSPDTAVGPASVTACEGEHWDGQDTVSPEFADEPRCTDELVDLERVAVLVAYRACPDPSTPSTPLAELDPVGVRSSTIADSAGWRSAATYFSLRVESVAHAAAFASACTRAFGPAIEIGHAAGSSACQSGGLGLGHVTLAFYARDDMPFGIDLLARILTGVGPGPGGASDDDCSQETYDESMWNVAHGLPPTCERDNTAVTIELLA